MNEWRVAAAARFFLGRAHTRYIATSMASDIMESFYQSIAYILPLALPSFAAPIGTRVFMTATSMDKVPRDTFPSSADPIAVGWCTGDAIYGCELAQ